mmetsp:Transcript_25730/g.53690  ORF Transcript_25730/g.53690 Transcript_25730/m.53690 type:complete len:96 (+) Transcript_25730:621-908(+)
MALWRDPLVRYGSASQRSLNIVWTAKECGTGTGTRTVDHKTVVIGMVGPVTSGRPDLFGAALRTRTRLEGATERTVRYGTSRTSGCSEGEYDELR